MTETEWLSGTNPEPMLDHLRGRVSDRKLGLLAVACCRLIWGLLPEPRCRAAVEVAERYADGLADLRELTAARTRALTATQGRHSDAAWASYWTASARPAVTIENVHRAAAGAAARAAGLAASSGRRSAWDAAAEDALRGQADLLREVVGNPCQAVGVAPAWLSWSGGTVPRLAGGIYAGRRFEDLPILADALEEAGCDRADLLAHLRSPGPHVLGCWALDALLGKC